MGPYLTVPNKEKHVEDGKNAKVTANFTFQYTFGACGMQGWRNTMEDSHIAAFEVKEGVSFFGVYDGHGGKPISFLTVSRR